jgi:Protein of unknown function (DUF3014)
MKNSTKAIMVLIGVVLIAVGLGNWYFNRQQATDATHEEMIQPPAPKPAPAAPPSHFPVTPTADSKAEPLPALLVSDTAMRNAITNLIGEKAFLQFFFPGEIIKRIVVSTDNLPRENVSAQLLPLKPVGGQFAVKDDGKVIYLDEANFNRYESYVDFIQHLDTPKLVALYQYFYPLFQQQYQQLGYPDGYFNDRLIAVIDYMIKAPEVTAPVQLVQKHVQYQFADPEQEKMSAGQKLFARIGHDNTLKIKDKLRELRAELTK